METNRHLIRQVRQRLEGLSRAGVDRLPIGPIPDVESPPAVTAEPASPSRRPADPPARPPSIPRPARPSPAPAPAPSNPATVISSLFDEPGIADPVIPPEQRPAALASIAEEIAACTRCPILCQNRTKTVPGTGNPTARLMFIGEGPGQSEDESGLPFVGRSGQLLTDMITKGMGLTREEVFIANIIKCRPPGNRDPEPEEVRNCIGYLERQIAIVRPSFLCLLGKPAAQTLLSTSMPMGRLRGKWQRYKGIPTIATYHPSYLLRTPSAKKDTWADLQMLMKAMGIPIPKRDRG